MATQFAAQAITITAGSLSSGTARESAAVTTDTANNVNDYRITVKATTSSGTPAGAKAVFVWVKISDDGTNWDGNATAADAAITLDVPHQFKLGGVIPIGSASITRGCSFSLKAACGGSVPQKWGIIIENQTGITFSSVTVGCAKEFNT